jgi:hypothetical protein
MLTGYAVMWTANSVRGQTIESCGLTIQLPMWTDVEVMWANNQGWQKPGFFVLKTSPVSFLGFLGFIGFYWVFSIFVQLNSFFPLYLAFLITLKHITLKN